MTNNVISFPTDKIVKPAATTGLPPRTEEEVYDYGDYVSGELASLLIMMLAEEGASGPKNELFYKDVALILEATKACVHRMYHVYHPLNTLSDDIFKIVDTGNPEHIVVKLKDESDE